jgi:tripartite-type tricarboxylate transporter receptor subunit TctC
LRQPEATKALATDGAELVLGTPAEATALLKNELTRWAATIKEANVKPED